jgi:asparagine synthase (glutamine-hydrolysing)
MLKIMSQEAIGTYGIASHNTVEIKDNIDSLRDLNLDSRIIIGHIFSKTLNQDRPQPIQLHNAVVVFEGRTYPPPTGKSDAETVAERLKQPTEAKIKTLIRDVEGDFAVVAAEHERLIAGRDRFGARPLYYGENECSRALASERKALWKIGIENPETFPPRCVAVANANGFIFTPAEEARHRKPTQQDMQTAANKLLELLRKSIMARTQGIEKIAVAFSGGLDSSLIALLAKQAGTQVHLIHASLRDQPETEHAIQTATQLDLPIHIHEYTQEDLEQALPNVLWTIEEADPIKASIAIPIYWAAKKAAEMKLKIMLAGQCADELFGGYKRYVNAYARFGGEQASKMIRDDITKLHEANLERDAKICASYGVELRLPFLAREIVELATDTPIRLKMEPKPDTLRKLVLRQAAKKLGLPESVLGRPKKAIQYATGVDKTLRKLARSEQLSTREYLQKLLRSIRNRKIENE